MKDEHLHIRIGRDEMEKLKELAKDYGLGVSSYIRMLIAKDAKRENERNENE